jgi:hypothetical protein
VVVLPIAERDVSKALYQRVRAVIALDDEEIQISRADQELGRANQPDGIAQTACVRGQREITWNTCAQCQIAPPKAPFEHRDETDDRSRTAVPQAPAVRRACAGSVVPIKQIRAIGHANFLQEIDDGRPLVEGPQGFQDYSGRQIPDLLRGDRGGYGFHARTLP